MMWLIIIVTQIPKVLALPSSWLTELDNGCILADSHTAGGGGTNTRLCLISILQHIAYLLSIFGLISDLSYLLCKILWILSCISRKKASEPFFCLLCSKSVTLVWGAFETNNEHSLLKFQFSFVFSSTALGAGLLSELSCPETNLRMGGMGGSHFFNLIWMLAICDSYVLPPISIFIFVNFSSFKRHSHGML